mmetsp:Transcript_11219/g.30197  ORF Transcript_11219/g.30197 Transcript_11219/m.30197 type:complete len:223 (+) Transcript_11219:1019-1687(+)
MLFDQWAARFALRACEMIHTLAHLHHFLLLLFASSDVVLVLFREQLLAIQNLILHGLVLARGTLGDNKVRAHRQALLGAAKQRGRCAAPAGVERCPPRRTLFRHRFRLNLRFERAQLGLLAFLNFAPASLNVTAPHFFFCALAILGLTTSPFFFSTTLRFTLCVERGLLLLFLPTLDSYLTLQDCLMLVCSPKLCQLDGTCEAAAKCNVLINGSRAGRFLTS